VRSLGGKVGLAVAGALGFLLCVIALSWQGMPALSGSDTSSGGDVVLALSTEAWATMVAATARRAEARSGNSGVQRISEAERMRLMIEGQVVVTPGFVQVQVLEQSELRHAVRVRILRGRDAGREGWVKRSVVEVAQVEARV
jgi:hypothetical protein